jgi:acyl-CoA thioester hydrolase
MEQFRSWGFPYADLEDAGIFLVITDMHCKCRSPARFDQILKVTVWAGKMTRFRIRHQYDIRSKSDRVVAVGRTAMAAVDKEGVPVPLPDALWRFWQSLEDQ